MSICLPSFRIVFVFLLCNIAYLLPAFSSEQNQNGCDEALEKTQRGQLFAQIFKSNSFASLVPNPFQGPNAQILSHSESQQILTESMARGELNETPTIQFINTYAGQSLETHYLLTHNNHTRWFSWAGYNSGARQDDPRNLIASWGAISAAFFGYCVISANQKEVWQKFGISLDTIFANQIEKSIDDIIVQQSPHSTLLTFPKVSRLNSRIEQYNRYIESLPSLKKRKSLQISIKFYPVSSQIPALEFLRKFAFEHKLPLAQPETQLDTETQLNLSMQMLTSIHDYSNHVAPVITLSEFMEPLVDKIAYFLFWYDNFTKKHSQAIGQDQNLKSSLDQMIAHYAGILDNIATLNLTFVQLPYRWFSQPGHIKRYQAQLLRFKKEIVSYIGTQSPRAHFINTLNSYTIRHSQQHDKFYKLEPELKIIPNDEQDPRLSQWKSKDIFESIAFRLRTIERWSFLQLLQNQFSER